MRQQRGLRSGSEPPASFTAHLGPPLSGDRVDRLLERHLSERPIPDERNAAPMHGIWLGVGVGVVLWCLVAGLLLLIGG